jgi:AbrB family looped-hinge helix DNA binding protein
MESYALTKVTRNGQITLPAALRHDMHIEEGDFLEVRATEGGIMLIPKHLVDKDQAYFWSPSWQAAEREAGEDIAAGRMTETSNSGDLVRKLEKGRKKKQ